ncbi:arginine/serine-rich protein PNISR isoform X2 [Parasteatoda tepidariorum]|uniref:arginine/serine-rich protein PNISR isoform X2 n=1 Tax=Parasteatoda tepidariorum TaxID=114398 RepID=UPI0039BD4565
MWGSQGWNQWALQPAMFNDVPHEQIDWAELAKQWIQMQQTPPSDGTPSLPPQIHPPVSLSHAPGHPHIPDEVNERNINPPLLKTPAPPSHVSEIFHTDRPFESDSDNFMPKSGETNFWSKPQWSGSNNVEERLWNAPVEPVAPPIIGGKETFDYGHVHDNPPLAMQTIDYNHMSDYPYNQVYTPPVPPPVAESQYDQYWSQVNAAPTIAPIFLKKERNITSNVPAEEETTQLDAAKRKQLPAWIRDGLEKMEQERLKRLEKERNAKEREEKLSKVKSELNSRSPSFVPKSKFDSDSEDEQVQEAPIKRNSPILKRMPSPIEDLRTEEEKKQDMMLKVRRTLTEVLLSVTNTEMVAIAQEVYKKAKSKGGLASYDSGSEGSDAEDRSDSSDSEEELYRKIKEKKRLFAVKEKKIIADLDRKELEDKTDREKMNNGNMTSDKIVKENIRVEVKEEIQEELNPENSKLSPMMPFQRSANSNDIPFISENESAEDSKQTSETSVKPEPKEEEMNSSEYSSSSDSESNSSEMNKKKSHSKKDKSSKNEKRERSPSRRERHHKRKSRDSDSSGRHKRSRSPEKKSSNKKRKKSKRSDSSSSSSSVLHKKKSSKKHESNRGRSRRSRSYEDRRRRSSSHTKSHHRSEGHSNKSSRSHRHHDDKRSREEKRYKDSHRSPSPYSRSSKIPRKYRASRSLSSESEIYGKKSKKSRNH